MTTARTRRIGIVLFGLAVTSSAVLMAASLAFAQSSSSTDSSSSESPEVATISDACFDQAFTVVTANLAVENAQYDRYVVRLDGPSDQSATSGGTNVPPGEFSLTFDHPVAPGDTIQWEVTDPSDGVPPTIGSGTFSAIPCEGPAVSASVSDAGTVTCVADGLKPDSTAQCSIASDPTVLGAVKADSHGHAEGTFPLPLGIQPGTHTVSVSGFDVLGNAVTFSTNVTVSAAAAAAVAVTAGTSTSTGSSTSAVTATPTVTG